VFRTVFRAVFRPVPLAVSLMVPLTCRAAEMLVVQRAGAVRVAAEAPLMMAMSSSFCGYWDLRIRDAVGPNCRTE
jgi:ABC-type transport system involved in cytochrome c biogenesis permease subunit